MRWESLMNLYAPDGQLDWVFSHAQLPILNVGSSQGELFFTSRDDQNRSRPVRAFLAGLNETPVVQNVEGPILSLGKHGAFDDCGVMPTSALTIGEKTYLYYIGWNVRNTVPYHNSIGLAIRDGADKPFVRVSEGPLFDRNLKEPYFSGTACVMLDNGCWRMWYLSCTEWLEIDGKAEPRYLIRYAESDNGIDWRRDGTICIDYAHPHEAIASASVVKKADGTYLMLYSYRDVRGYRQDPGQSYRMGYAISQNGVNWERIDKFEWVDNKNDSDWDAEMQAYPHLFDYNEQLFMLYNGNGFGQSGFGLARLVNESAS